MERRCELHTEQTRRRGLVFRSPGDGVGGTADFGERLTRQTIRVPVACELAADFERAGVDVEFVDRQRAEIDGDWCGLSRRRGLVTDTEEDRREVAAGGCQVGREGEIAGGFDVVGVEIDDVSGVQHGVAVDPEFVQLDLTTAKAKTVRHGRTFREKKEMARTSEGRSRDRDQAVRGQRDASPSPGRVRRKGQPGRKSKLEIRGKSQISNFKSQTGSKRQILKPSKTGVRHKEAQKAQKGRLAQ